MEPSLHRGGPAILGSNARTDCASALGGGAGSGILPAGEGPGRLDLAACLGVHSVPSRKLWHGAVARAVQSGVAAYDTLFVELAIRERLPLATFDAKVIAAFPEIARRPGALLGAA